MKVKEIISKKRAKYGLTSVLVPCTSEEEKAYATMKKEGKPLPDNIKVTPMFDHFGKRVGDSFERIEPIDCTDEEINELLKYKELDLLTKIEENTSKIKTHTGFFFGMAILSIILSLIALLATTCA